MIDYKFDESSYTDKPAFEPIPEGNHRVKIFAVEEAKSSTGNDMLKIELQVSGQHGHLWHYIVFGNQYTNNNVGKLFSCFHIADHNINNYLQWIGHVGVVNVKHTEYEGRKQAKIHFLLSAAEQEKLDLPAWVEPTADVPATSSSPYQCQPNVEIKKEDLPF